MPEGAEQEPAQHGFSRRTMLRTSALATALATLDLVGKASFLPARPAVAATASLPDIQFDIGNFISAPRTVGGIMVQLPPVHTTFLTAKLTRTPSHQDQSSFANALAALENNYQFAAGGVMTFVAYGIPYFNRLPGGLGGSLASRRIPRLASDPNRLVLEEAVPSPTDVSPSNPGITK